MTGVQLGGAILASAGVAAILTHILGARNERARWLRDRKLDAVERYLQSVLAVSNDMLKVLPGDQLPRELIDRALLSNQALLILMAPRAVIEAAKAISDTFAKWVTIQSDGTDDQLVAAFTRFGDSISVFSAAARADLGTDERDNPKPSRWDSRNE